MSRTGAADQGAVAGARTGYLEGRLAEAWYTGGWRGRADYVLGEGLPGSAR